MFTILVNQRCTYNCINCKNISVMCNVYEDYVRMVIKDSISVFSGEILDSLPSSPKKQTKEPSGAILQPLSL